MKYKFILFHSLCDKSNNHNEDRVYSANVFATAQNRNGISERDIRYYILKNTTSCIIHKLLS